ncbi:MAG: alpha/beta hydrolase [Pseudomonadales bacterium]
MNRMLRLAGRVTGYLGALIALLIVAGAAYQWWAERRDAAAYPMPGALVEVDATGRRLHLYCSGTTAEPGAPTVVLESGLTAPFAAWRQVQSAVETGARVCSYDRAGMGWSDPSPNPTRTSYVVEDLERLLDRGGVAGPLLLVGWSAGGVFVRAFAARNPRRVAGMVLVDSSHESQGLRLPAEPGSAGMLRMLEICRATAWSGVVRLGGAMNQILAGQPLPEALRAEQLALFNRTSYCSGVMREVDGFPQDVRQEHGPSTLGELPLIVITRGRPMTSDDAPPGADPAFADEVNRVWSQLQNELAALSSHSEHWFAEHSGHAIPYDQPEIVVRAINRLLDETGAARR